MKHPMIIYRPDLQSRLQRYGTVTLTVLFWALWLTLWVPVLTTIGWALGIHVFVTQMFAFKGAQEFLGKLDFFAAVVMAIVVLQIGWAKLNEWRFRGRNRRRAAQVATVADLATFFNVDRDATAAWQQRAASVLSFDDDGNITNIAAGHLPPRADAEDSLVHEAA